VGEAGAAELLVGAVEEVLGVGVDAYTADMVEAFEQAAVDGCGGFAVELLIDDGLDESFEGGLGAGDTQVEWTCPFDELTEFGIVSGEFAAGQSAIVARRARIVAQMRHDFEDTAGGRVGVEV
jgi:hypothetical protein